MMMIVSKSNTGFDVSSAVQQLNFSDVKFNETIEIQISFFLNLSGLGKVKKNHFVFPLRFAKPAGRNSTTLVVSDSLEGIKSGSVELTDFVSNFQNHISKVDKLLFSSECIGKIPAKLMKILSQKGLTPKEDMETSSSNITKLLTNKQDFETGRLKHLNFVVTKYASTLYAPLALTREDSLENWKCLEEFILHSLPAMLDLKKRLVIKQIYVKTTMGKPVKISKI